MKEFILKNDSPTHTIDYANELNPEQLEVVLHGDGPVLVLAGAGSGKTRTITYRVAYLLEQGIAPQHILFVTFTNKAAKEMLGRVEQLMGAVASGLWGGTFHSIASRLLRKFSAELGYSNNFTILDEEDARSLLKSCIQSLDIDTTAKRFPSPSALHSLESYARNSGQSLSGVIEARSSNFIELIPTLERVIEVYEQRKRQADSLDFDDLLLKFRELLYTHQTIRESLANQFQYILVDEYQDTNIIQAEIVQQLASVHGNVLVVGDDAQSIYSFRAAQIRNILRFSESYTQAKTFRLTTNYRSTPEILAVANASISQNKHQFEKKLSAVCPSCEPPQLIPAATSAQESQFIAQKILALRDQGISMKEIAVLFRAAFHSQTLEFELMKRDIPYEYRGGMKFFERAHVKDIIAHLRIRLNPRDEVAWMRILGLMKGIGLATAQKIVSQLWHLTSLDEIKHRAFTIPARAQTSWTSVRASVQVLTQNELPHDLIRAVIAGEYREYLQAEYPDFMDRLEDLEQFALFAQDYTNLQTFLDEVCLSAEYGALKNEGSAQDTEKIVLSTIHQAKGLEWDAVFVMHLSDGHFPNPRSLAEEGGLEEERRLFYVAATRARKHLFFSYALCSGYDTLELSSPSLFLQELPEELLEEVRLKQSVNSLNHWDSEQPTIVFNSLGERVQKSPGLNKSFLREIDEL